MTTEKKQPEDLDDVVLAGLDEEIRSRNQAASEAWGHSPANYELMSIAGGRLIRVNKMRGGSNELPEKVQAAFIRSERTLLLWPISPEEHGFKVTRSQSSTWINLRPLLYKVNELIPKGEKWRFGVSIDENSRFGIALKIDLKEVREKSRDSNGSKKKNKNGTTAEAKTETNTEPKKQDSNG